MDNRFVDEPKLQLLGTAVVSSMGAFSVSKSFGELVGVGSLRNASLRISMTPSFKARFFGKMEENVPCVSLKSHELLPSSVEWSYDKLLTTPADSRGVYLYHLMVLLRRQARGQAGVLGVDGRKNSLRVLDVDGVACIVHAVFSHGVWRLSEACVSHIACMKHLGGRIITINNYNE